MATSVSPHYTMKLEGVEKSILQFMNQERKKNGPRCCEVVLLASKIKHYAHKIVLTSFSDFFRRYFEDNELEIQKLATNVETKSDDDTASIKSTSTSDNSEKASYPRQTTITLPGINSEELDPILEYMYTSTLELKSENINEILLVACLLQVTSVIEFCAEVLMKQPKWRSPLVSPKIMNYVKRDIITQEDAVRSSPTAVTWATNGGKPTSHETRIRRQRGRNSRNGWGDSDEMRTSGVRRRREIQRNSIIDGDRRRGRRISNYDACGPTRLEDNAFHTNGESAGQYNERNRSHYDYPLNIDYDDLNRKMPLIQAGKLRSNFCLQEQPVASSSLETLGDRQNTFEKSRSHWRNVSSSLSPKQQRVHPYYLVSGRRENAPPDCPAVAIQQTSPDEYPRSIIPQLIDYRRLLHAAQATALGLQLYPPTFSNVPLIPQVAPPYSTKSAIDSVHTDIPASILDVTVSSNALDKNASSLYSGSVSTFSPHVSKAVPSQIDSISKKREVEHVVRPSFKRFAPDVIHDKRGDSKVQTDKVYGEARKPVDAFNIQKTAVNGFEGHSRNHLIGGRVDFKNSNNSSFTKPIKLDSETLRFEATTSRNTQSGIDYHQRKRKLILGAQDHRIRSESTSEESKEPLGLSNRGKTRPVEKKQCSSEDDIIAREYNKYHLDGSDFDSDDSGRASSV